MQALELTDGVITLRPFGLEDAAAHLAGEDEEKARWLGGGQRSTLETVTAWIERNQKSWEAGGPIYSFAVWRGADLVGVVEAQTNWRETEAAEEGDANIAYEIYPSYRGKGYATRAVQLMMSWLAKSGYKRALIRASPENVNSLKLPQRLEFTEATPIISRNGDRLRIFYKELST